MPFTPDDRAVVRIETPCGATPVLTVAAPASQQRKTAVHGASDPGWRRSTAGVEGVGVARTPALLGAALTLVAATGVAAAATRASREPATVGASGIVSEAAIDGAYVGTHYAAGELLALSATARLTHATVLTAGAPCTAELRTVHLGRLGAVDIGAFSTAVGTAATNTTVRPEDARYLTVVVTPLGVGECRASGVRLTLRRGSTTTTSTVAVDFAVTTTHAAGVDPRTR